MKRLPAIALLWLAALPLFGQGLRGTVRSTDSEPLSFATIYIKQLETGVSTNADGRYEIKLAPGTYDLIFQYLGYQTQQRTVTIGNDFQTLDMVLAQTVFRLKEAEVSAKAEDPAYTIMRKAIAKSKFHALQLDGYSCRVYTKGSSRVIKVPFFLRKTLKKEGIDSSTVFLVESISDITYTRPNTYDEKVISIRRVGDQDSIFPVGYIHGSFYRPKVAGAISPLSPRAFGYYRFRLEGSYFDRDYEINKIRVIPRSRGDNVFNGYIYIIEDLWSIHSLDLKTYTQGIPLKVRQIYAPIQETVWLPVTHDYELEGKILGFAGELKYLATVSDYRITLNPDLKVAPVVIDETIDKELAEALEREEAADTLSADSLNTLFSQDAKLTRKTLRKAIRKYEKQEREASEEPEVVSDRTIALDSNVYEKDSAYWESVRPIPLDNREQSSYRKLDSMAVVRKANETDADTVLPGKKGNFGIFNLLLGDQWTVGKKGSITLLSLAHDASYNTVEGYYVSLSMIYKNPRSKKTGFSLQPTLRWAAAREKAVAKARAAYQLHPRKEFGNIAIEGGRYVQQFNEHGAISPHINFLYTLLWERNFLKLYEKDFLKVEHEQRLLESLTVFSRVEWAERRQLFNNSSAVWINNDSREFTPNLPENQELATTAFPEHQALLAKVRFTYRPFLKYYKFGGKKREISGSSPTFHLEYNKGFKDLAGSDVDFDHAEVGVAYRWRPGVRGVLHSEVFAGTFLRDNAVTFIDFKHFQGSRTIFQSADPSGQYRLLDYYNYSTTNAYIGGRFNYQFRKFLFSRIWELRLLGLQENILVNYLKTETSPHLWELGYSLDNIFRLFRIELVTGWEDGEYQEFGVRLGLTTSLSGVFGG